MRDNSGIKISVRLEYIMKIFKYVSKMGSKAVCVFRRRKLGHFADLNEVCENTSTSANVLFSTFIFSDYTESTVLVNLKSPGRAASNLNRSFKKRFQTCACL